jgi:diguanylate cyclase (GGDEF)-like protein/PAS domain S-box-containing protein
MHVLESNTEDECFKMMARHSPDVLCCLSFNRQCIYCSPSSLRVLGWSPDEMLLYFPNDLIHARNARGVEASHQQHVSDQVHNDGHRAIRVRRKDGSYAWLEVTSSLMRRERTNAPWKVLLNMRDVSKRELLTRQLESMALTDPLTNLGNRRAFAQALEHEWGRARRHKNEISLLMLDVDNFKAINDTYGHLVGDEHLSAIASTIASAGRRAGDMAARYGGEEFVLILPSTDGEGAAEVAEHLRAAIKDLKLPHIHNPDHDSVLTVSVGAATALLSVVASSVGPSSLLRAADQALYRAKQRGRNRVETTSLAEPHR